jgi:hypothetical protein
MQGDLDGTTQRGPFEVYGVIERQPVREGGTVLQRLPATTSFTVLGSAPGILDHATGRQEVALEGRSQKPTSKIGIALGLDPCMLRRPWTPRIILSRDLLMRAQQHWVTQDRDGMSTAAQCVHDEMRPDFHGQCRPTVHGLIVVDIDHQHVPMRPAVPRHPWQGDGDVQGKIGRGPMFEF